MEREKKIDKTITENQIGFDIFAFNMRIPMYF